MTFDYLQLHAPEPPRPRVRDERERNKQPVEDEPRCIIIDRHEPENNHVITIDI